MSRSSGEAAEVLFTLASDDRLAILRALRERPLKLTQIAKHLASTPQETSRHLTRLARSSLIARHADGSYALTGPGSLALRLLPAWEVLADRREFFLGHDLLALPDAFLDGIGALSRATYEDGLSGVLAHTEAAFKEAREYVWLMADQVLDLGFLPGPAIEARGLTIRSLVPVRAVDRLPRPDPHAGGADWPDRFELGLLDEVRFGIAMNERSAGIVFADAGGRLDFNRGFRGADPRFHRWCHDLFDEAWSRAKRYRPL